MATPKAVYSVSTPRNPHASTPNRPTASPRHNAGAFANKSLAYKSPAAKTPAPLHGHSHRISISSHPTSTPLTAPAIHDELLNMNSPAAALIASIGTTGLTPLGSGADGLGITSGITPHSIRDVPLLPKNPEVEKLGRLEKIAKLLKTKTAGRGITRDGVERLAQIQGFTILWDEDNLTIAGNSVDLEITFDGVDRDQVRDVQLRLNLSGSEEPQLQKDASKILQTHLTTPRGQDACQDAWDSLKEFSQDLKYLSRLDYIDSSTNCFELMQSLYTSFRTVWDEEATILQDRPAVNHVCVSNVGMPSKDNHNTLGITAHYWIEHQSSSIQIDSSKIARLYPDVYWTARFSCEKGSPGIAANHEWLADRPLMASTVTEDVFQEGQIDKPNWNDAGTLISAMEKQTDADAMLLDGPENSAATDLDLVFSCHLKTRVVLPINAAATLNNQYTMLMIDQTKALPYQKALTDELRPELGQDWGSGPRWSKSVSVYNDQDVLTTKSHSYSLFATGVPWSYPVDKLQFVHPRQFAEALPILRQYALLWSILRNTVRSVGSPEPTPSNAVATVTPSEHGKQATIKRRNNKKVAQTDLEDILSSRTTKETTARIDLSLDLLSDVSKAKVEIIVPLSGEMAGNESCRFAHITVEILRNGRIAVPSIRGPPLANGEKLKRKAVKVLGLSEDLSVLVEWFLGELTKSD